MCDVPIAAPMSDRPCCSLRPTKPSSLPAISPVPTKSQSYNPGNRVAWRMSTMPAGRCTPEVYECFEYRNKSKVSVVGRYFVS